MLWCDRVNIGEQAIKVAQNLPAGYLSCEQTGAHRPVVQHSASSNNNNNNNLLLPSLSSRICVTEFHSSLVMIERPSSSSNGSAGLCRERYNAVLNGESFFGLPLTTRTCNHSTDWLLPRCIVCNAVLPIV